MKIRIGFSPCPNDTFIFDALVNKKLDSKGMDLEILLEDVQTLNQWAIEGRLDVTKISYGVLPLVLDDYILLNSGGALGKGVGPLLIAKHPFLLSEINTKSIAIPGVNTTAHLLFSMAFPEAMNKNFRVFNQIEDAVLHGETDAGVIIHENRFTYQHKGLIKLIDLGEYWENNTGVPIPLGGIVAKRTFDRSLLLEVDRLIKESVQYAFQHHYKELSSYVRDHAQEMNADIMRQHIDLYVNNYSLDLGENGRKAVVKLMEVYQQLDPRYSAASHVSSREIFLS